MKHFDIEGWARRVCECVQKKQPVEDSRVELKSEWPDPLKAARRICGHANAAHGDTILWLIGVDETRGVVGVNHQEFSTWWASVKSAFESEVPSLQELVINVDKEALVAICFETTRFPYLIKNRAGGELAYEVPWRDGTSTRTARRGDLLLMLASVPKMPKVELLDGHIFYQTPANALPVFRFQLKAYFIPSGSEFLCFPFHKCEAFIASDAKKVSEGCKVTIDSISAQIERATSDALGQRQGIGTFQPHDEFFLKRPEMVFLEGKYAPATFYSGQDNLELRIALIEAISDQAIGINAPFKREKGGVSPMGIGNQMNQTKHSSP